MPCVVRHDNATKENSQNPTKSEQLQDETNMLGLKDIGHAWDVFHYTVFQEIRSRIHKPYLKLPVQKESIPVQKESILSKSTHF